MKINGGRIAWMTYQTILHLLAVFGIIFIMVVAYWWPVIDRLYIRPCHYYPNTFINCNEEK